jgi:hypothetical protein
MGVRKLVVAGGETSGALVKALKVEALRIGATINPGVPWTLGLRDNPIAYWNPCGHQLLDLGEHLNSTFELNGVRATFFHKA